MGTQKDINKKIGANIRRVREDARYTQERLSELVGITPNHLSAIERGASGISFESIEKVCRVLGVSADRLLFGENDIDDFTLEIVKQLGRAKPVYRPHIRNVLRSLLEMAEIEDK